MKTKMKIRRDDTVVVIAGKHKGKVGKVLRVLPEGEGHRPHVDAYTFEDTRLAVSTLLTLIQPEEGGETRFLDARPTPLAVQQRRGRLIAWTSTLPGGADDPASRHDGAPVVRGAKAVLLAFVYRPRSELLAGVELRLRG